MCCRAGGWALSEEFGKQLSGAAAYLQVRVVAHPGRSHTRGAQMEIWFRLPKIDPFSTTRSQFSDVADTDYLAYRPSSAKGSTRGQRRKDQIRSAG
jgi:hypothetical protein